MQITSSASALATSFAAVRSALARPASGQPRFDLAQARADSAEDKRRFEENAARHSVAIASFASQGLTMTQGSYTTMYKKEMAQSIDSDGDGSIGIGELAAGLGDGEGLARASRLHAMLDIDGDGRLGLEEFGDSLHDPFRDAGFRRQLDQRGAMDPAAIGALHRRHAAQYDAGSVLRAMASAIDTVA